MPLDASPELFIECRTGLGLTGPELAEMLTVDWRTLSRGEGGDSRIPGAVWLSLYLFLTTAGERELAARVPMPARTQAWLAERAPGA